MQFSVVSLVVLLAVVQLTTGQLMFSEPELYDCKSDDTPDDLDFNCTELQSMGACNETWFMQGEYCISTCDFCGEEALLLSVGRSFGIGLLGGQEASEPTVIEQVGTTVRGCKCPTWKYNGVTYTGCGNPDKSTTGGWCPVNQEDCPFDPLFTSVTPIEVVFQFYDGTSQDVPFGGEMPYHIDSCSCLPEYMCRTTESGCKCLSACGNPDYDLNGPWCFVDETTCSVDKNELPFKGDALDVPADYCKPGCCPQ
eukprot:TRINITY_DN879_c0_g2_i1.p1 TRINITY_DN879_c0_g2~~TRINITY_DN879_c0_g2_i1.p1  ORF type:complete len:253 (-),score=46.95 TRINITY_DN879_c0_g2_i1:412-1170(-)